MSTDWVRLAAGTRTPRRPDRLRGHHPPIQWAQRGLSLWLKWPGRESDASHMYNVAVKDTLVFMLWCLIKHKNHVALTHLEQPS
jgi:hypothetical protein